MTSPSGPSSDPQTVLPATDPVAGGVEADEALTERLVFFSDAVLAIALTLLAVDLPLPDGRTNAEALSSMGEHRTAYLAFLISFLVIYANWSAHHRMFRYVTRLGGWLGRWNMLWLLTMVLTPFATRVVTGAGADQVRFTLYAAVQAAAALCWLMMLRQMRRHRLLREHTPPDLIRTTSARFVIVACAFLVSIPLAFVVSFPWACWLAIPLATRATRLLHTRRHRAPSAPTR